MSLGITGLHSLHWYVHDLDRTRQFLVERLDFAEVGGRQSPTQTSAVFQAGECVVCVSSASTPTARPARFLTKHPEGIGAVVFSVQDADRALATLERRGGTPITGVQRFEDDAGRWKSFSITTPLADTTFRFVEDQHYSGPYPGFQRVHGRWPTNKFGFTHFDHVTCNHQTMAPALLWLEHVLGFERYWDVAFHTADLGDEHGSGLKSVVMWDPNSGFKMANNEPARPAFRRSQINVFAEDHRGAGVQHAAMAVKDIIAVAAKMKASKLHFLDTPDAYYEHLPTRLKTAGITLNESIEDLRRLGLLVDGDKKGYLLQAFLHEASALHGDKEAGAFFFEVIERMGDDGFGAGNFRALFESIERSQEGRA